MLHCPKVILFDLDDTLISFEGVAEQAWEKCCAGIAAKYDLPDRAGAGTCWRE